MIMHRKYLEMSVRTLIEVGCIAEAPQQCPGQWCMSQLAVHVRDFGPPNCYFAVLVEPISWQAADLLSCPVQG